MVTQNSEASKTLMPYFRRLQRDLDSLTRIEGGGKSKLFLAALRVMVLSLSFCHDFGLSKALDMMRVYDEEYVIDPNTGGKSYSAG